MRTLSIRHDAAMIREACIDRESFSTHGAMYGERSPSKYVTGRLPAEYVESFRAAEYALYSYGTPIAWYGPSGWTFPPEKYSVTTSRHQSKIYFIHGWIEE